MIKTTTNINTTTAYSLKLLDKIAGTTDFKKTLARAEKGGQFSVSGLTGSLTSCLIAALSRIAPVTLVVPDSSTGEAFLDDLYPLLGEERVCFLPPTETSVMRRMTKEVAEHHRAETLRMLIDNPPDCMVALPGTLVENFPSPKTLRDNTIELKPGITLAPVKLVKKLMNAGFKREAQVEGCGELAMRGGIVDVFPFGQKNPFRLEFWGDEIVSIREFDSRSQRSIKEIDDVKTYINRRLKENNTVFDLLPGFVFWERPDEIIRKYQRLVESEIEPSVLVPEQRPSIVNSTPLKGDIDFAGKTAAMFMGAEDDFLLRVSKYNSKNFRVMLGTESVYRSERLESTLSELDKAIYSSLEIGLLPLQKGFIYPAAKVAFFTERELYDRPRPRRSFAKFRTYAHPVEPEALQKGDFVVHVDYGIGVFAGLKTVKVAGHERECLHLKYRDEVNVYVRLEAFSKVQKYSGRDGFVPVLSKIGGKDWKRSRERTKQALLEMAKELISVQAKRKVKTGYSFSRDDVWQKQMEESFIHQDTSGQKQAAEEIKRDMEMNKPMDRLLLADVGFGKTEIAIRAAFKAVQSNRQVALLAPTTILVEQHLQTFKDRMSEFPIRIESLSRFRTPVDQRKIIKDLHSGAIDVVIGTHRLLSKDVDFRRLGLIIIDEEHRFGVKHKEKLKKLREEVDVLTLTATPIPRTLRMALAGTRDLSRIDTPPADRMPIVTEIVPFDKGVIRESLLHELNRGGQVFFVHNRVRSIGAVKAMLSRTVPEARYGIAHGQMSAKELEKVMLEFMQKKIDCLICTMIVESGIDLPNVNTMIINRADKLGLAQLYQLRGRIGRSDRQAYAYLLIPPRLALSDQARSRLETISMFTELGAGFQVALRDLEIRGAGNILGAQQSGFVNNIGFDLYSRMLEEAIEEVRLKQGLETYEDSRKFIENPENGVEISFSGDAYIPIVYISDENLRVNFYRRMSQTGTSEELKKLEIEMRDRFGKLPEPLENLLGTISIKILSSKIGFSAVEVKSDSAKFAVQPTENGHKELIENCVKIGGDHIEFLMQPAFAVLLKFDESSNHSAVGRTKDFLARLNEIYNF